MLVTLAALVAVAGACGAAACGSSSAKGGLDAAANMAADAAGDANANMAPDAAGDACEDSSPPECPLVGGVDACTWAQAEQGACQSADAGSMALRCIAESCGGAFNALRCDCCEFTFFYYYDPSGALFAALTSSNTSPSVSYNGPCTFNPPMNCPPIVDAGCASGDGQGLDSGSPDSSAD